MGDGQTRELDHLAYFGMIEGCIRTLRHCAPDRLAELEAWDREHVAGDWNYGTSDWPGFEEILGVRPPWRD